MNLHKDLLTLGYVNEYRNETPEAREVMRAEFARIAADEGPLSPDWEREACMSAFLLVGGVQ